MMRRRLTATLKTTPVGELEMGKEASGKWIPFRQQRGEVKSRKEESGIDPPFADKLKSIWVRPLFPTPVLRAELSLALRPV